jgi:hypothetical protein
MNISVWIMIIMAKITNTDLTDSAGRKKGKQAFGVAVDGRRKMQTKKPCSDSDDAMITRALVSPFQRYRPVMEALVLDLKARLLFAMEGL